MPAREVLAFFRTFSRNIFRTGLEELCEIKE
jgi:hypothetical protein